MPAFVGARDINTRMVTDTERGRRDTYTFPTLEDIAAAYGVTYDSVRAVVWAGAAELVPAGPRALPPAPPGDPPGWAPDRVTADRPFVDPIIERRVELAFKGVVYPDGAQMFGEGTEDARAWDEDFQFVPVASKMWGIADLRAAPPPGPPRRTPAPTALNGFRMQPA